MWPQKREAPRSSVMSELRGSHSFFFSAWACGSDNDAVANRALPCSVPRIHLALHVEPDAYFDNQRDDPHGSVFFASPNGTVRSFLPTRMIATKRVAQ